MPLLVFFSWQAIQKQHDDPTLDKFDQHGLSALKNWYFLTGSSDVLKKVWKDYGIMVVPKKEGDVIHTSAIIFVDRSGKEVYQGTPQDDGSTLIEWSNAISYILKKIS